ncbi:MAG TPA: hypothetical protein PLK35_01435 [Candidatus Moranbacteria bacterium]|nr:hypothetical protein [Candidatus Moranbacteria bacterium]
MKRNYFLAALLFLAWVFVAIPATDVVLAEDASNLSVFVGDYSGECERFKSAANSGSAPAEFHVRMVGNGLEATFWVGEDSRTQIGHDKLVKRPDKNLTPKAVTVERRDGKVVLIYGALTFIPVGRGFEVKKAYDDGKNLNCKLR